MAQHVQKVRERNGNAYFIFIMSMCVATGLEVKQIEDNIDKLARGESV